MERARLAERLVVCYGGAPTHFFSVLHPRTHEPIQLGRTDTQLLELRCFSQPKEKPASWLLMAGEPKEGAASGGLAAGEPKVAPALLAPAEATPSDAHEQMASARVEGDEHEATAQRADPPVPKDGTGQEAGSADDSTVQHVKEDAEEVHVHVVCEVEGETGVRRVVDGPRHRWSTPLDAAAPRRCQAHHGRGRAASRTS